LVRTRIYRAIKSNKSLSSTEYIGCDLKVLKQHLEQQFEEKMVNDEMLKMTWENHGKAWEVDHIIPLKYKENNVDPNIDEVIRRLHYSNLQPLWSEDNRSKGSRYVGKKQYLTKEKLSLKIGTTKLKPIIPMSVFEDSDDE
jgi:hypothetical protein